MEELERDLLYFYSQDGCDSSNKNITYHIMKVSGDNKCQSFIDNYKCKTIGYVYVLLNKSCFENYRNIYIIYSLECRVYSYSLPIACLNYYLYNDYIYIDNDIIEIPLANFYMNNNSLINVTYNGNYDMKIECIHHSLQNNDQYKKIFECASCYTNNLDGMKRQVIYGVNNRSCVFVTNLQFITITSYDRLSLYNFVVNNIEIPHFTINILDITIYVISFIKNKYNEMCTSLEMLRDALNDIQPFQTETFEQSSKYHIYDFSFESIDDGIVDLDFYVCR